MGRLHLHAGRKGLLANMLHNISLKLLKYILIGFFQITKGIQNHVLDTLCSALCQELCKFYCVQFSQAPL